MKVAVVVLNYKGWQDTKQCLQGLKKQTYKKFEIYLIENGSGDESAEELSKIKMKNLHFHQEPKNTGFTGGVNIGIRWAMDNKFDAVALLNNDAVPEPKWLETLVKAMKEHPEAGAATGLMLDESGTTISDAGDIYSIWGIPSLRAEGFPREKAPESGFVFGATGGGVLYCTRVFENIGLFDEDFFAYNEDVDIDWRMQLAGYKIWYEKSAVICHKISATSSKIPGFTIYQVFKNLPQVFWKNVPFPMIIPMWFRFTLVYIGFMFYKAPNGGLKHVIKGVWQGLLLWPKALKKRRHIQKSKVASNEYIKSILLNELPLRQVNRIKKMLGLKRKYLYDK